MHKWKASCSWNILKLNKNKPSTSVDSSEALRGDKEKPQKGMPTPHESKQGYLLGYAL